MIGRNLIVVKDTERGFVGALRSLQLVTCPNAASGSRQKTTCRAAPTIAILYCQWTDSMEDSPLARPLR